MRKNSIRTTRSTASRPNALVLHHNTRLLPSTRPNPHQRRSSSDRDFTGDMASLALTSLLHQLLHHPTFILPALPPLPLPHNTTHPEFHRALRLGDLAALAHSFTHLILSAPKYQTLYLLLDWLDIFEERDEHTTTNRPADPDPERRGFLHLFTLLHRTIDALKPSRQGLVEDRHRHDEESRVCVGTRPRCDVWVRRAVDGVVVPAGGVGG